jgi:chloramphenicol-sensitive protein RarD
VNKTKVGLFFGVASYMLWGLFPLYWPLLKPANPLEIVAHRAVWTLVFCTIVLGLSRRLRSTLKLLTNPQNLIRLFFASIFISGNWLIYVWGVNHGHVVECALGYYINPLVIVLFGVILLKERLHKLQWVAIGIASIGVIALTIDYGHFPWIAIAITLSWGSYGLIKKKLGLGALEGLALETLVSFLPYLGYLVWLGNKSQGQFGHHVGLTVLLMGAGVVTAVPLLLFNGSVNRLPFTIIGLLQYITPTAQLLIAVLYRHEIMTTGRWIGFFIVWIALFVLGFDLVRSGSTSDDRVAELD